jgi:GNAT superfamily N-acetyltransferase
METAWDSYKADPKKLQTVPMNFLDYFIEQEPEHILVAADEKDEAVGYIECAASYKRFKKAMRGIYLPRLKEYDPGEVPFEKKFLLALFFIRNWQAHLHINLTAAYQHQGLGERLIKALIAKLQEEGQHTLSVCGCQRGSSSYFFYLHCGFKEIFRYGNNIVSLGIKF